MTARGVFAGADKPTQKLNSAFGLPGLGDRRHVGQQCNPLRRTHREHVEFAAAERRRRRRERNEIIIDAAGHHFGEALIAERHVAHVDIGGEPQSLAGHV